MKKKTLVMVMASFCTSPLYAAAFDRTGQSISAFLQPGNYFEASLSVSDTSLEGQEAGTNPVIGKRILTLQLIVLLQVMKDHLIHLIIMRM